MTRQHYTLGRCHECGRETMTTPQGQPYPHRNLNDWPKNQGTNGAPMCQGMTSTVTTTGTLDYDEATGHYHRIEVHT